MRSVTIPYRQEDHGDFDAEWPIQRGVSGWWCNTGHFAEASNPQQLYSYQSTVIKPRVFGFSPHILQLALTDVHTGKHAFTQRMTLWNNDIFVTEDMVNYLSLARLRREANQMVLTIRIDRFGLDLTLKKGKGAFWHGNK